MVSLIVKNCTDEEVNNLLPYRPATLQDMYKFCMINPKAWGYTWVSESGKEENHM